jgi:nitroreductase/NAD-dependent dihydropyrimidine dehydrogenase PreA subunit
MSLLSVDQEKCKRDGICAEICPAGIIEIEGKKAFPKLIEGGEALCIRCGHCVAVCPAGAMSHERMSSGECPPVREEWLLTPEQVEHFLRLRRSIRVYKHRPVEKDVLESIINVARFAPSGHNRQPVQWTVVYDSDEVQRLTGLVVDWMRHLIEEGSPLASAMNMEGVVAGWEAGFDPICRKAPHLIVANANKDDTTAPIACTIALTYLEIAALSYGLGTCWAGYFNAAATFWPPLHDAMALSEGHVCLGSMMIGYPKFNFKRLPLRNVANVTWR